MAINRTHSSADFETLILERLPDLFGAAHQGDTHQLLIAMRQLVAHLREFAPEIAERLNRRVFGNSAFENSLRGLEPSGSPIATENSAPLLKHVQLRDAPAPILAPEDRARLDDFIREQEAADQLLREGLLPRSTVLLTGPPGVGKTMLARWMAARLGIALAQVELAATVSSYLGRTGQNLKEVLDFARRSRVVLLLDEFDALAKRRDDQSDLGELKRVVSVLLKELEEWTGPSIVVAATNHEDLIDPAIYRRFQFTIRIELPDANRALEILRLHLKRQGAEPVLQLAAQLLAGTSGSEIRDLAMEARREIALRNVSTETALLQRLAARSADAEHRKQFARLARQYLPEDMRSMAHLADLLGVAKSTVHSYLAEDVGDPQ